MLLFRTKTNELIARVFTIDELKQSIETYLNMSNDDCANFSYNLDYPKVTVDYTYSYRNESPIDARIEFRLEGDD